MAMFNFRFPHFGYFYPYNRVPFNYTNRMNLNNNNYTNIGPISINIEGLEDINKPLFDFLGIKLFLDDIIIICILIFLYKQKVQDESLYLILILLLWFFISNVKE